MPRKVVTRRDASPQLPVVPRTKRGQRGLTPRQLRSVEDTLRRAEQSASGQAAYLKALDELGKTPRERR